ESSAPSAGPHPFDHRETWSLAALHPRPTRRLARSPRDRRILVGAGGPRTAHPTRHTTRRSGTGFDAARCSPRPSPLRRRRLRGRVCLPALASQPAAGPLAVLADVPGVALPAELLVRPGPPADAADVSSRGPTALVQPCHRTGRGHLVGLHLLRWPDRP